MYDDLGWTQAQELNAQGHGINLISTRTKRVVESLPPKMKELNFNMIVREFLIKEGNLRFTVRG